jgi:RNase H-fold protein (predicted Holliday junction resolvase)
MAREDLHFRLRIPEELKAKIEGAAQSNRRSMTAEIIDRLEASFGGEERLWDEVNRISDAVEELHTKINGIAPKVEALWDRPYDGK